MPHATSRVRALARTTRRTRTFIAIFACAAIAGLATACTGGDQRGAVVTSTSNGQLAIDSLLTAGDSVYRQSPERAAALWTRARQLAESLPDSARLARALTGLGQAARQRSAYDTARALGEQALALKQRLGMTGELFRSYNSLGLNAWNEGRSRRCHCAVRGRPIRAARAVGDPLGVAKSVAPRTPPTLLRDGTRSSKRARTMSGDARGRPLAAGDSTSYARALGRSSPRSTSCSATPKRQSSDCRWPGDCSPRHLDSTGESNARGQPAAAYSAIWRPASRLQRDRQRGATRRTATAIAVELADNLKITADMYLEAGDPRHALRRPRLDIGSVDRF